MTCRPKRDRDPKGQPYYAGLTTDATAAKSLNLLIPASFPTLSVTRPNTIPPLDHSPSSNPTPMCSRLYSAFSACKVSKSSKSTTSNPVHTTTFTLSTARPSVSYRGKAMTGCPKTPSGLEDGKVIWRRVWFPNRFNNDASASVAISSGLLNVESEKLTSERGSVEEVQG